MNWGTKMNETPTLVLALLAGVMLGSVFFGGLWWTILKGVSSKRPAVWFLSSMVLRATIAVAGLFFVSHGDWRRLLVCLLGFLLARIVVMRLTRAPVEKGNQTIEGGRP